MDELLDYFDNILQFAASERQNLSPVAQERLAEFIQMFSQFIEEVGSQEQPEDEEPAPTPQGVPELEQAMPSSNVEGFAYNPETEQLFVRFLGKHPNRRGAVYSYQGVPEVMFNLFRQGAVPARTNGRNKWGRWWRGKTPSMGASVYTLLRQGGFQYRRES